VIRESKKEWHETVRVGTVKVVLDPIERKFERKEDYD